LGIVIGAFAIIGNIPLTVTVLNKSKLLGGNVKIEDLPKYIGLNTFFIYILFPFIVGLIALLISWKFILQNKIISLFTTRSQFDWKRFFFSFCVWGAIMFLFLGVTFLFGAPILWNLNQSTFIALVFISFLILPIQTTFEEVLFRGFLFQGINFSLKKGWIAVFVTGTLFGLMHGSNPEVDKIGSILLVFYIVNGVFLGIVTLMDGGLELTMGYHAVNNIFAALILTNDWQAFHTDALFIDKSPPSFGLENILTLLIIQPLLLVLFAKRYKWNNWKEKLLN
jgi:membrane protease YdiL (CAAX protease family)